MSPLVSVCVCLSASTDNSRVKRMCVAERRQPYSGADWCSGGESDEDDKGFFSRCLNLCFQAILTDASTHNLMGGRTSVELWSR